MLFPEIPENFADLSVEELEAFYAAAIEAVRSVTSAPQEYVTEEVSAADLLAQVRTVKAAAEEAKAELAARAAAADEEEEVVEEEEPVALSDEEAEEFANLAVEIEEPEEVEIEVVEEKPVVASVPAIRRRRLPTPTRDRQPVETREQQVPLIAAAGPDAGMPFPDIGAIAAAMKRRRANFGMIPEGTSGEKVPVARADWSSLYPGDRRLSGDFFENMDTITAAVDPRTLRAELERRIEGNLAASGGLCAPVTPYYQLAMISQAMRPVRAGLPSFNADRGGLRFARPAALTAVTTGVGVRTASEDAAGGTYAAKTCQVIDCPSFEETDVQIIYHCLQFGNLGARTFPELLNQWNQLTLAAHARLAETELLTGIDTASTQVTAGSLGLGASATLFSQIMAAASAMRSRHRMDPEAVLRVMLPWWSVYLIVSDVFRGQFDRFEVDQARVVQLLRSLGIEPSFYIDGAAGRQQVFGPQSGGSLLSFPSHVVWYLFPEGSFLFLDGGTLELGLVRDSILNSTNDFQIFGETFENVAFVGVESLAVQSTACDTGTVSLPKDISGDCPISY